LTNGENGGGIRASGYAVFLLFLTVLIYAQTIWFPFLHFDDIIYIANNTYTQQWKSIPSFFTSAVNSNFQIKAASMPNLYRPATSCWILFNFKLFGNNPAFWHLSAVVLYVLSWFLLWRIVKKLTGSDFISIATAFLYALHPLHVEGVAWIAGAFVETLVAVFFLGGFLAYLRWRDDFQLRWLILCGILVLLGLLSKESAAALPVLIVCHALIFRKPNARQSPGRDSLILTLGLSIPIGIYAILRRSAIHGIVAPHPLHAWSDVFRTIPLLFTTYLKNVVWPMHLSPWYDARLLTTLGWKTFYFPLIICLAYAGITLWALRRKPLVGFFLLWWALALGPSLAGIISYANDLPVIQDRFTFVALAGLCPLVALAVNSLPGKTHLFGFKASSVLVVATVAAFWGILSALQVGIWRDDISLAEHGIQIAPHTLRPRVLLASELNRKGDFERAVVAYRNATELAPDHWEIFFGYGLALESSGQRPEAIRAMAHAAEISPSVSPPYLVMADLLTRDGKWQDAIKVLTRGITVAREPELLRRQLLYIQQQGRANTQSP
jgi:hypothetical protein